MKVNETFKEVDLQWLVYGNGNYPNENSENKMHVAIKTDKQFNLNTSDNKTIDRIVIFYTDGTFKNYNEQ